MKTVEKDQLINENEELNAIIDYVPTRWDGATKEEFKELLENIWIEARKVMPYRFNNFNVFDDVEEYLKARQSNEFWNGKLSKEELDCVSSYDHISTQMMSLLMNHRKIENYSLNGWDYSTFVSSLSNKIKHQFQHMANVKPMGWKELEKNYIDFNGQEEYWVKQHDLDVKDFTGVNSEKNGPGFILRIALPYVMYDDKCQGRNPFYILVGSMVAHAMFINEHNNSVEIKKDLKELIEELNKNEYKQEIIHNFNLIPLVKNNIVKAMLALNPKVTASSEDLQQGMQKHIDAVVEFNNLPDDKKEERKKENAEKISKMMSEIMSKPYVENVEKKQKEFETIKRYLEPNSSPKNKFS